MLAGSKIEKNEELTIHDLPNEILEKIFSYLTPQELANAGLVSTLWRVAANYPGAWREMIKRFLPDLEEEKALKSDPKGLFKQRFGDICKLIEKPNSYNSHVFMALGGEISEIEKSSLEDEAKQQLYQLAAANGC